MIEAIDVLLISSVPIREKNRIITKARPLVFGTILFKTWPTALDKPDFFNYK
jgi:hypothetical protein